MTEWNLRLDLPTGVVDEIAAAVAARIAPIAPSIERDQWHLLDVDEVATRLGRSGRWVRERVKRGELPFVRLDGGAFAFELADVQKFATDRRIDVQAAPKSRRLRAVEGE